MNLLAILHIVDAEMTQDLIQGRPTASCSRTSALCRGISRDEAVFRMRGRHLSLHGYV